MNLGYYYHMNGDLTNDRTYMEKGMAFMSEHDELNNDVLIMLHNYANLMSDCGEPMKAIAAMKKTAGMIKENHTAMCSDYADLWLDIGIVYMQANKREPALSAFETAFNVYRKILSETELQEKAAVIREFYVDRQQPDFLVLN